jgi:hypothetical protein
MCALVDAADAALKAKKQVDVLFEMLGPHMQSNMSPLRSWSEFLVFTVPDDVYELQGQMERNISYFQGNYLLIATTVFVIAIVVHPAWLFSVSLLVGAWVVFVSNGGLDPAWKPKLGEMEIAASHRLLLLYASSLSLLFLVFGETLLVLFGAVAMLTMLHAAFRPDVAKGGERMHHAAMTSMA